MSHRARPAPARRGRARPGRTLPLLRRGARRAALLIMVSVAAMTLVCTAPRAAARPLDPDARPPAAAASAPRPAAPNGPARAWAWPLDGQPAVLRPFEPPKLRWAAGHRGVDLATSVGGSVLAPTSGTVSFVGVIAGRGIVVVTAGSGLRTTLEPVDASVAVGQEVQRGEQIGTVEPVPGHCAPATCLHWGVLRGDTYLDPLALLGLRPVVLLPLDSG